MNNQDYIRKAVELADGWELIGTSVICSPAMTYVDGFTIPECLDALAAQLRKQAQADPHITFVVSVVDSASFIEMLIFNPNGDEEAEPLSFVANETDEAMAFIKVTVDSKVLEKCPPHDFRKLSDGTARCRDCKEQVDITETGAAR